MSGYDSFRHLTPSLRRTLQPLLHGCSEKEIAGERGLSAHTVHDHVKALHKLYCVATTGELLAKLLGGRSGTSDDDAIGISPEKGN